jgi:hypothetical protein
LRLDEKNELNISSSDENENLENILEVTDENMSSKVEQQNIDFENELWKEDFI